MKKIKHILKTILCALSIFVLVPTSVGASSANIVKVTFTTSEQTVALNTQSEALTIQLQNASGEVEKLDETADMTFTSSSATGQFLGSTGNPVTTTMSNGSANRTFYYKDLTSGTETLNITVKGRVTGKEWSTSQQITIGSSGGNNGGTTGGTDSGGTGTSTDSGTSGTKDTSNQTQANVTFIYSSHSSPSPLSTDMQTYDFKVSAGRNRLTTSGSAIRFRAEVLSPKNLFQEPLFEWSFGDGMTGVGREVEHAYHFSGMYSVILTAHVDAKEAVSRAQVKVSDPLMSLPEVTSDYVEISNTSAEEVNLKGWILSTERHSFLFPADTIISPKQHIRMGLSEMGIVTKGSEAIALFSPLKKQVASALFPEEKKSIPLASTALDTTAQVNSIVQNITYLKHELALMQKAQDTTTDAITLPEESTVAHVGGEASVAQQVSKEGPATTTALQETAQTATVLYTVGETKSGGFFDSLFSLPKRGLTFITNLFH